MKRVVFLFVVVSLFAADLQGQSPFLDCGTTGTGNQIVPMINVTQPFVAVFVDFADGRDSVTGLPPSDTLGLGRVKNLNAVGSFGWIKNPLDTTRYIKKVRKYFYEDYWDHFFSIGEWVGNRHPDFVSHQGLVWDPPGPLYPYDLALYGSVREYWKEVSYGNMTIQPGWLR